MNTKIYLPKPCLEKWDKMTSIEKEKLCKICSRKVYDLTKMDTTEIVSLIDSGDRICGKIEINQLNKRPFSFKKFGVLISLSSFFCFSSLLYSNTNNLLTTLEIKTIQNKKLSYNLSQTKNDTIIIFGNVKEGKIPLPKAKIKIKGTSIETETDFDGNFKIKIPFFSKNNEPILEISHIGMITKEVKIKKANRDLKVELENEYVIGEVIYKKSFWSKIFG